MLRIMDKMLEAKITQAIAYRIKIIGSCVPKEIRDWSVEVSTIKNDQHVID